jgi:flagellar basal-body rod modification protein FlgD
MATSALSGVIQGQVGQQTPSTVANSNAFDKMDLQQFIKLLVTELQNQDPMNPTSNSEILQQISQIKSIASNDKLSTTLASMQLQQDMTSASVLLNQTVKGLASDGTTISGKVDKVSVAGNKVQLYVGTNALDLKNVSEINGAASSNEKMTGSLSSIQLQQDMMSGNALMNQTITGLNANGKVVHGKVDKVSIDSGAVTLHIGTDAVPLKSVSEIDPSA